MDTKNTKKSISRPIRFSPEEIKMIDEGSRRNGLSEGAYIRLLIHHEARRVAMNEEETKLIDEGSRRNGLSEGAYVSMLIHQEARRVILSEKAYTRKLVHQDDLNADQKRR